MSKKTLKWKELLLYGYLYLPVLLFLLFWMKWYFSLIAATAFLLAVQWAFQSEAPIEIKERSKDDLWRIGFVLLLIVLFTLTSGVGASVPQYPDHGYRNTLFKTLIDEPWPVKLWTTDGHLRVMCYYIGFWLPAALVGKYTSYSFALLFLQIWCATGLFLIWLLMCERMQKVRVWYLLFFLFFGGADIVGTVLTGNIYADVGNRIEWWNGAFVYPGVLTQLFWVFNQAIYGWLVLLMMMRQKDNKSFLLIWTSVLLCSSFASIGVIPFALFKGWENQGEEKGVLRLTAVVKNSISVVNVLGVFACGWILVYLAANVSLFSGVMHLEPQSSIEVVMPSVPVEGFAAYEWSSKLMAYLWFILLEVGIYFVLLFPSREKHRGYWLTLLVLLLCPLIQVGTWIDFCMRANIPAILFLCLMTMEEFEDSWSQKRWPQVVGVAVMCFLSLLNGMDTLRGVMEPMSEAMFKEEAIVPTLLYEENFADLDNFFGREEAWFHRYIMK